MGIFSLLGIVAGIIALIKGHRTYAFVMFGWFALGLILTLLGVQYATVPGWLFVIIAICMKKVVAEYPEEDPQAWKNGLTKKEIKEIEDILIPTFAPSATLTNEVRKARESYKGVTADDAKNPLYFCHEDYLICTISKAVNSQKGTDSRIPALANRIVSRYEYIKSAQQEPDYPESYYEWARKSCFDAHNTQQKDELAGQPSNTSASQKDIETVPSCACEESRLGEEMPCALSPGSAESTKATHMVVDQPQIKFCRKCGHELLEDSDFCSNCGTRIIADIPLPKPYPDAETSVDTIRDDADDAIERLLHSPEFKSAYNALSDDQKERFFLRPDRELDAARVTYSIQRLIGQNGTIQQLLEIYITIFSRIIVAHMPPERIAVTLNMRYSSILNVNQQYIVIAYTEAHINGMSQGFYISNEQDIEVIVQTARACQESAVAPKEVSKASDYGFSADNPIRVQSLPAEYSYLERLVYDNGQVLNIDRVAAVDNANGDMIDYFKITVSENGQEKQIALFLDGYSDSPSNVAPQGFHLK